MRQEGYYWVKVKEPYGVVWEIDKWYLPRHSDTWQWGLYTDSDILEIDERRIERDQNPCWCKLDALALKNSGYIE